MTGPTGTRRGRIVWVFLLPVLPLCAAGVATIHVTGADPQNAWLSPDAVRQIRFILAGLVVMTGVLLVGYHRLGRAAWPLFAVCVAMLAVLILDRWVNLGFVPVRRNTRRWLLVGGLQIQPSELMKIAYVLAIAWYLRYRRNYRTLGGLLGPFVITLVPMGLILLQPDLGTVLLFLPVLFAMLFVAGARLRHLAVIVLLGLLCAPLFFVKLRDYQRLRITGVLLQSRTLREALERHPDWWDALRSEGTEKGRWWLELTDWETHGGYQLVHSKAAIGSGGITGQGYGRGPFVEHNLLPERHNDFIFAMVAHQWGLVGALAVILCYACLVLIGFEVSTFTDDPFGRLLAVGLTTMLAVQVLTNLCMTVGLGPITGITLPFVSAGGSSMVASFLLLGLVMSVARHRPMLIARKPFEFDEDRHT